MEYRERQRESCCLSSDCIKRIGIYMPGKLSFVFKFDSARCIF